MQVHLNIVVVQSTIHSELIIIGNVVDRSGGKPEWEEGTDCMFVYQL